MRLRTLLFVVPVVFSSAGAHFAYARAGGGRPNVVLIIWDDPNLNHFGFLGNGAASTPGMDRLATEGIRFTNAVTMPRCAPALAQMLSGKACIHPRNGVCWNGTPTGVFQPTKLLPQLLFCPDPNDLAHCTADPAAGDYWTFGQGKVSDPSFGFFDDLRFTHGKHDPQLWRYVDPGCTENPVSPCLGLFPVIPPPCPRRNTITGPMGAFFTAVLDPPGSERPWFMWICARLPHSPFDPPLEFMDRIDCTQIDTAGIPPEHLQEFIDQEHKQLALTAWMDDRIGELLWDSPYSLQELGLLENTWVINVVGDNGYTAGTIHKGSPYRAGAGCWVSFWMDGLSPALAGSEWQFPVDALDIPATIIDFAEKTQPASWSGKSLRPWVEYTAGPPAPWAGTVYSAAFTDQILDGDANNPAGSLLALHATTTFQGSVYHYVFWYRGVLDDLQADAYGIHHDFVSFGSRLACQEELYDVLLDPGETNDLLAAPTPPPELLGLAADLQQGCFDWWLSTRAEVLPGPVCGFTPR